METKRLQNILELAQTEAREHQDDFVKPVHLALAILREGGSVASAVLESVGTDLQSLIDDLTGLASSSGGGGIVMGKIPFSPAATNALQRAQEFSAQVRNDWIGVEHLLVGLLWEDSQVRSNAVTDLFTEHGASFRQVWFETQRHLQVIKPIPLPSDGSVPENWTVAVERPHRGAEEHQVPELGRIRVSTEVPIWVDAAVAAHAIANIVTALSELHIAAGGKGLVIDGIEIDVDAYASAGW